MKQHFRFLQYALTWSLLLAPLLGYSQKNHYHFDGKVAVAGGATYKYQLDFKEEKNIIKGYSYTWLDYNIPSRAEVIGTIDKVKRTITFAEHEDPNILMVKFQDMCFFSGTLAYEEIGDMFLLSGRFTGFTKYTQYCGQGEITMSHSSKGDSLLGVTIKPRHKPVPIEMPPPAPVEHEHEVITAARNKELDWESDTCTVQLWDYGNVDGDIVTVFFHDKKILTNYELTGTKKEMRLPLHKGYNILRIEAENEGSAAPNTARMLLLDGNVKYSFTAYNVQGKSATIILKSKK